MTVREENEIARCAADMWFKMNESDVECYVYESCGKNPFIFKDIWQKVIYFVEVEEI